MGTVQGDLGHDAGGQGALDGVELGVDRLGHGAAVLAHQHQGRAHDHLVAVLAGRPRAQFAADGNGSEVPHPHG